MTSLVAVQMDDIRFINPKSDSTVFLLEEAQARGYSLCYFTPAQLSLKNLQVRVHARILTIEKSENNFYKLGMEIEMPLSEADIILMRNDPPFDIAYIAATHLLEFVSPKPLIINNPRGVRNAPEKISPLLFPQFIPPTLISRDRTEIARFLHEEGQIIMKPLFGHAGNNVFFLKEGDKNFDSLLDIFSATYKEPWINQRFLPNINKGDKRLIIINGELVGAFTRLPGVQAVRSNLARGGTAVRCTVTDRDRQIIAALAPYLRDNGIIFAGVDVIDNYMTEINITSPTGLRTLMELENIDAAKIFWDVVENILHNHQPRHES